MSLYIPPRSQNTEPKDSRAQGIITRALIKEILKNKHTIESNQPIVEYLKAVFKLLKSLQD